VSGAFPFVVVLALIAVLGALGLGLFSMARGGEFNARYGNKLMRLRVGLQFAAIVLVILAILASGR
jgi:hypothetical protein